jgi:hypothetical protein
LIFPRDYGADPTGKSDSSDAFDKVCLSLWRVDSACGNCWGLWVFMLLCGRLCGGMSCSCGLCGWAVGGWISSVVHAPLRPPLWWGGSGGMSCMLVCGRICGGTVGGCSSAASVVWGSGVACHTCSSAASLVGGSGGMSCMLFCGRLFGGAVGGYHRWFMLICGRRLLVCGWWLLFLSMGYILYPHNTCRLPQDERTPLYSLY